MKKLFTLLLCTLLFVATGYAQTGTIYATHVDEYNSDGDRTNCTDISVRIVLDGDNDNITVKYPSKDYSYDVIDNYTCDSEHDHFAITKGADNSYLTQFIFNYDDSDYDGEMTITWSNSNTGAKVVFSGLSASPY